MTLTIISNLYPRPDHPTRGLFNWQAVEALARMLPGDVQVLCLVPEWRVWRWPAIRRWRCPAANAVPVRYAPVFYLPLVGRDWSAMTYAATGLRRLRADLADGGAVLTTWLYPDCAAVARCLDPGATSLWLKVHGSDIYHLESTRRRAAILSACRTAAGVVCVAQHLADQLAAAGVTRDKLHVVPNGIDSERFQIRDQAEARGRVGPEVEGLPAGTPLVLAVGNLVPVKGMDRLIRAWPDIRRDVADARLVIIGDGPQRGPLAAMAAGADAGSIHFLGVRSHADVATWMNAADCLCLPSRSEGMPNVVLEARASGLPVAATDVGACRDLLGDDPAGFLCPAADADTPASLAEVVVAALLYKERTLAADSRSDGWGWDAHAAALMQIMGLSPREDGACEA